MHWDNKVIIYVNNQISIPPQSIIYFILKSRNSAVVLISSNKHFLVCSYCSYDQFGNPSHRFV